ncbi:hypothetical protein DIPPA_12026 [Diplonema papillatum]|nr:hypothetical protein DIPPA_12026 [Diplonema papillatum]
MFSMRAYTRGSLSHASKSERRILYGRAISGSIRWAFARMVSTAVTFLDGCFVPKAPFTTRDRSPLRPGGSKPRSFKRALTQNPPGAPVDGKTEEKVNKMPLPAIERAALRNTAAISLTFTLLRLLKMLAPRREKPSTNPIKPVDWKEEMWRSAAAGGLTVEVHGRSRDLLALRLSTSGDTTVLSLPILLLPFFKTFLVRQYEEQKLLFLFVDSMKSAGLSSLV